MRPSEYLSVGYAYNMVRQDQEPSKRLTFAETAILCKLALRDEPMRICDLADWQGVSHPTMTSRNTSQTSGMSREAREMTTAGSSSAEFPKPAERASSLSSKGCMPASRANGPLHEHRQECWRGSSDRWEPCLVTQATSFSLP